MRRRDFLKAGAVLPAALLVGCATKSSTDCKPDGDAAKKTPGAKKAGTCLLCYKCGQVKGSALCCVAGADTCSRCGLHKGSPGCCRLGGAQADVCLCTYCGQIKGSDLCCKPGATKCSKCGLVKGSPGCCRIKKEKKPGAA